MADVMQIAKGMQAGQDFAYKGALEPITLQQENIKLQEAQQTLKQQQQMMTLMQQKMGGGGGIGNGASQNGPLDQQAALGSSMYDMAQIAMQVGAPEKAMAYAKAGSEISNNASLIKKRSADFNYKNLSTMGNLLQGVNNEQDWQRANAMFTMMTGQPSPYQGLPYNPDTVKSIFNGVTTAKDQAAAASAEARAKEQDAEAQYKKAMLPLIQARTTFTRNKIAAQLKNGGVTGDVNPKAMDITQTKAEIKAMYPSIDSDILGAASIDVATNARYYQLHDGMDRTAAIRKATSEAIGAGMFAGQKSRKVQEGTIDKPATLPTDRTQLKNNTVYMTPKGAMLRQNGMWTPITPVTGRGGAGEDEGGAEDSEENGEE